MRSSSEPARTGAGAVTWRLLILLTSFCLAWSVPAGATLLVYEPFDYAPGLLEGSSATGFDLTGVWAGTAAAPTFLEPQVVSPGLHPGSLIGAPPVAGNALSQNQGTTSTLPRPAPTSSRMGRPCSSPDAT